MGDDGDTPPGTPSSWGGMRVPSPPPPAGAKEASSEPTTKQLHLILHEDGRVQIRVKLKTGKELTLDVDPNGTVDKLKKRIEEEEHVPPERQRLMFSGKQLEDGRTLQSYGITYEAARALALQVGRMPTLEDYMQGGMQGGLLSSAGATRGLQGKDRRAVKTHRITLGEGQLTLPATPIKAKRLRAVPGRGSEAMKSNSVQSLAAKWDALDEAAHLKRLEPSISKHRLDVVRYNKQNMLNQSQKWGGQFLCGVGVERKGAGSAWSPIAVGRKHGHYMQRMLSAGPPSSSASHRNEEAIRRAADNAGRSASLLSKFGQSVLYSESKQRLSNRKLEVNEWQQRKFTNAIWELRHWDAVCRGRVREKPAVDVVYTRSGKQKEEQAAIAFATEVRIHEPVALPLNTDKLRLGAGQAAGGAAGSKGG